MFVSYFLFPKLAVEDIHLNLAKVLTSLEKLFNLTLEHDEQTEKQNIATEELKSEIEEL